MDSFWKELKNAVWEGQERMSYIPYRDSNGKLLCADEIIFTDEKTMEGKQNVEVWGQEEEKVEGYTIFSQGITPLYDESGNFPIALMTENGDLKYLKVAKTTGEVLPIHAGCCQVLSLIYVGPPSAGKTVNVLQLSDPAFHNMIAKGTSCSIEDDIPSQAPKRKRYETARAAFKKHILPPANKLKEVILPYVYYVQYGEGEQKQRVLLKIEDVDGQQCTKLGWENKLFYSNYFIVTIGADEILRQAGDMEGEKSEEDEEEAQYERVINQLLPRLRVLRRDRDFTVLVTITKCDLLDKNNPYLKDAFENSVEYKDGKWKQNLHENGFDHEAFERRSKAVEAYLKNECSNIYNKLLNAVPRPNITFCMIASVGNQGILSEQNGVKQYRFENYEPFCVDEPLLSVMTKAGVYPSAGEQKACGEPVKGFTGNFFRDAFSKMMETIRNLEEEYDGEEDWDDDDY